VRHRPSGLDLRFRFLTANRFRPQGSAPPVAERTPRAASCLRCSGSREACVSIFRRRRAVRGFVSERPLRRRCLISSLPCLGSWAWTTFSSDVFLAQRDAVSCLRRSGASSRFLRPQVRCPILHFARSAPQLGLGSRSTVPPRLVFCAASSSRFCFPSSSHGARRQALSHHHCRASVLEFGQHFPSFTAFHRHAVQHLSEIPPHSVAVVRPIFPKVNLGLMLRFRCRWFLSPVLHKRRRFFVGSSRFAPVFPPLA
jgi:hypothetical protein